MCIFLPNPSLQPHSPTSQKNLEANCRLSLIAWCLFCFGANPGHCGSMKYLGHARGEKFVRDAHIKYGSIFEPQLVISPWCPHTVWKHIRATTGHYCNSTATVPHQCQNSSPIVYELNINLHIKFYMSFSCLIGFHVFNLKTWWIANKFKAVKGGLNGNTDHCKKYTISTFLKFWYPIVELFKFWYDIQSATNLIFGLPKFLYVILWIYGPGRP